MRKLRIRKQVRKSVRKSSTTKRIKLNKKRKTVKKGGYGRGSCPFVGPAWVDMLKGFYYPLSKTGLHSGGVDPYYGNSIKIKRGGAPSWIPQPLVDLYRNGEILVKDNVPVYGNKWTTGKSSISPDPYVQPRINKNIKVLQTKFPDIEKIYNKSNNIVAKI